MKLHNRILSTLLAVIMMMSSFAVLGTVGASAETTTTTANGEADASTYLTKVYNTPEEKLELGFGEPALVRNGYELYVDPVSGEIAVKDTRTNNILFSNPYDVGSSKADATSDNSEKNQILSQLIVSYLDNNDAVTMNSFTKAAMYDQIQVLNIKNGVRVEYTIGEEQTRMLLPKALSEESYTELLLTPLQDAVKKGQLDNWTLNLFTKAYKLESLEKKASQRLKEKLLEQWPICEYKNIYVFAEGGDDVPMRLRRLLESCIKNFCEDYTYEQMEADHAETGYKETNVKSAVFKLALEYSLNEDGLQVVLPCNGLRYDMTSYQLQYISVLPFMGAGHNANSGYNFYPDGSGALFDFEKLNVSSQTSVRNSIYGADFAYHDIAAITFQKLVRYPVYGTVAEEKIFTFTYNHPDETSTSPTPPTLQKTETVSNTVMTREKILDYIEKKGGTLVGTIDEVSYNRGYVAIIESGESLAELETFHAGQMHEYNTLKTYFKPKPMDYYRLSGATTATGNSAPIPVASDRKYTGNISIRYQMLADKKIAEEVDEPGYTYYDTSWFGMAEAYRDYLVKNGTLTKLTEDELEEDIPLYVEVFGTLETQEVILSIPVDVMTPLTTFENIYTMYSELSEKGVSNINFKMTGFANGGMYSTVPASLKWEKAVGGKSGLRELINQAAEINKNPEKHLGLYPDFDFAYVHVNTLFDSTNLKRDAIKTIDNRYSSKRQYSATQQSYVSFYQLAISPSRFSKFYEKLLGKYEDYDLKSLSLASLGSALNSDFDEDDPYHREDGKAYTMQAFQDIQKAGYSIMSDSANAYTWKYVDHILNMDLDSSRYIISSASVPFLGVVLHGYMQYAGTPFNEEGDESYAILRAIENGAGLYFILSYQNTAELKEDPLLSQYYSIRYDIWKEDVISYYNELNSLLKDVQDKVIINHEFLKGQRVLDIDELEEELKEIMKDAIDAEMNEQQEIATQKALEIANAWRTAENVVADMNALISRMKNANDLLKNTYVAGLETRITASTLQTLYTDAYRKTIDHIDEETGSEIPAKPVEEAIKPVLTELATIKNMAAGVLQMNNLLKSLYAEGQKILDDAIAGRALIASSELDAQTISNLTAAMDAFIAEAQAIYDANAEIQLNQNTIYVDPTDADNYIPAKAVAALVHLKLDDFLVENGADDTELRAAMESGLFTVEDVVAAGVLPEENEGGQTGGNNTQDTTKNKYEVDNNQIVVVTYGDRDATTFEKTAYKSFILNYNNFTVIVDYEINGETVTYTIPAGGYVALYHAQEGEA